MAGPDPVGSGKYAPSYIRYNTDGQRGRRGEPADLEGGEGGAAQRTDGDGQGATRWALNRYSPKKPVGVNNDAGGLKGTVA